MIAMAYGLKKVSDDEDDENRGMMRSLSKTDSLHDLGAYFAGKGSHSSNQSSQVQRPTHEQFIGITDIRESQEDGYEEQETASENPKNLVGLLSPIGSGPYTVNNSISNAHDTAGSAIEMSS
jgi:hypothetical protein